MIETGAGLDHIRDSIGEVYPIGQIIDVPKPPDEVMDGLQEILRHYFEEEYLPALQAAGGNGVLRPPYHDSSVTSTVKGSFNYLFKDEAHKDYQDPQSCRIRVNSVEPDTKGAKSCIAVINVDIWVYTRARYEKDGELGWYRIPFKVILKKFRGSLDQYEIRMSKPPDYKRGTARDIEMQQEETRIVAETILENALRNPLQGGAPGLVQQDPRRIRK